MRPKPVFLVFLLIGFLLYSNAIKGEFVLDDHVQIVNNPLIQSFTHLPKLFFGSTFYSGKNTFLEGLYYRPIMLTLFATIYHFFGLNVIPFHLLQLTLHLLNAFLVYLLFSRFFPPRQNLLPLFLALIFLVHPINQEAVVYISNLQDVLFTFLGLLSLLFLSHPLFNRLKQHTLYSLLFLSLAFLTKEVALLYLGVNLIYLYLYQKKHLAFYLKWGLIITLSYAWLRYTAVGFPRSDRVIPIAAAPLSIRLMTLPRILTYYLSLFFYPKNLAIGQNWLVTAPSLKYFFLPITALCFFVFLVYQLGNRFRLKPPSHSLYLFFCFWFSFGLLIHSQLFPLDVTVADRWFYSTSVALLGLIGLALKSIFQKPPFPRSLSLLLSVLVIATLFARTRSRNADWQTAFNLYAHDIQTVDNSFTLENNLGLEYAKKGQYDLALTHLEKSVSLVNKWGISWNNVGAVYEMLADQTHSPEQYYRAYQAYKKAISYPAGYSPYLNLARLLVNQPLENSDTTRTYLHNSLKLYPDNPDLWFLLSQFESHQGNQPAAAYATQQFHFFQSSNFTAPGNP